jgi:hypothetical protein
MATYKLIQDIEAEDKILGPLTLRQFIFALISIFLFYICALLVQKHIAFLLAVFLPPALFFGFFALPLGRDQPTEVWALAKLRYFFKPRRRVWNQSGVKEMVTITVPKKVERVLTNGLEQGEVESRLKALASTLDTRGWAVKNVDASTYAMPTMSNMMPVSSERLIDLNSIPAAVPDDDMPAADDILDHESSPIAQQFGDMIDRSQQEHRQQLIDHMNSTVTGPPAGQASQYVGQAQAQKQQGDYWFMDTSQIPAGAPAPQAAQVSQAEDAALSAQLRSQSAQHAAPYGNLRTLRPGRAGAGSGQAMPAMPMTAAPDPAILSLANNDDLNVATLAHEAQRAKDGENPDEVLISLR